MQKNNKFLLFCCLILCSSVLFHCSKAGEIDPPSMDADPNLIFQTGFEGSSKVVVTGTAHLEDIIGIDSTLSEPNDWQQDFDRHPNIGKFQLYYEGGDATQRTVKIIEDPTNAQNQILHFWLAEANVGPGVKGRLQSDVYDNNGLTEIYQSVRVFFHADFAALRSFPEEIYWLTIFELWNNPSWTNDPYPFRVSVDFDKPKAVETQDLTFNVHGQKKIEDTGEWISIWEETDTQFSIPLGQWMTLELYIREGDRNNGQFMMSVTPENGVKQVLFDITNYTHHPDDPAPDGFSHFNPMKLYTAPEILNFMKSNDKALQVYWDDYKLWKDQP